MWIRIQTPKWTAAFDLNSNMSIKTAPPIAKWSTGKHIDVVLDWLKRKDQLEEWQLFVDGKEIKL